jgi:hypothetical protein
MASKSVELSLEQLVSIQLRLAQRIEVRHGDSIGSVGLRLHAEPNHAPCRRNNRLQIRIDYHDSSTADDYIIGCPNQYYDVALQEMVYRAIQIEDLGGLQALSNRALAHLPNRLVHFYRLVLSARDRLLAEQRELQRKLAANASKVQR